MSGAEMPMLLAPQCRRCAAARYRSRRRCREGHRRRSRWQPTAQPTATTAATTRAGERILPDQRLLIFAGKQLAYLLLS